MSSAAMRDLPLAKKLWEQSKDPQWLWLIQRIERELLLSRIGDESDERDTSVPSVPETDDA